jgi:hypothetical protein
MEGEHNVKEKPINSNLWQMWAPRAQTHMMMTF